MLPQHKSSKSLQVDAQWFCKFEYNTGVEFVFFIPHGDFFWFHLQFSVLRY